MSVYFTVCICFRSQLGLVFGRLDLMYLKFISYCLPAITTIDQTFTTFHLYQLCMPECLVAQSSLTVCYPMDCSLPGSSVHGLPCPWDSPSKNTGVGSHSLFQGIFPTQGLSLGILHCRQILDHLSHRNSYTDLPSSFLASLFFPSQPVYSVYSILYRALPD